MSPSECDSIQPLLFAYLEDAVSADERAAVARHLPACPACQKSMIREQTLTNLLESKRAPAVRRWRSRAAAAALVAAGIFGAQALLSSRPVYGSAVHHFLPLAQGRMVQDGAAQPLDYANHFTLATADHSVAVEVNAVCQLRATGPAAFELDGSPEGWKLVLLRGEALVEVLPDASLTVVSALGTRVLGTGKHAVTLTPEFFAGDPQPEPAGQPAALFAAGVYAFFQDEDMPAAERCFRAAEAHPNATEEQRLKASFYRIAALSRQERYEEAIALEREWLRRYPHDESVGYVLYFHGIHHDRLGRRGEAEAIWLRLIAEFPDSDLAAHARFQLETAPAPAAPVERQERVAGDRTWTVPAAGAPESGFCAVAVGLDPAAPADAEFLAIADAAAEFHRGAWFAFDGRDFAALEAELRERRPAAVLFVLRARDLDVDLHRRILLLAARLDDDLFPDFAFGYFTAADGAQLRALWERTERVHRRGLGSKTWLESFVVSQGSSLVYPDALPELARAAGFQGHGLGFAVLQNDPAVLDFVAQRLPDLERAGVIVMTGNGDPQGVWLFDDRRNLDRDRHWEYAPERVGQDPDGQMPRITAAQFRALRLSSPVVWSGTCHSAATHRVFVEADIVSTFGRSDGTACYPMAPAESLALSLLEAGAVALLAPIAANHGYAVLNENEFALEHGASLGETLRSTWSDVFLQAEGNLHLDLHGAAATGAEDVMQGGGANRALLGDPMLAPFTPTAHPLEEAVLLEPSTHGCQVRVSWKNGFHPKSWDLFGTDRAADWRVAARVPLPDEVLPAGARFHVRVRVTDPNGAELPYRVQRAAVETHAGRRYLHLQANAERRRAQEASALQAEFEIRWAL